MHFVYHVGIFCQQVDSRDQNGNDFLFSRTGIIAKSKQGSKQESAQNVEIKSIFSPFYIYFLFLLYSLFLYLSPFLSLYHSQPPNKQQFFFLLFGATMSLKKITVYCSPFAKKFRYTTTIVSCFFSICCAKIAFQQFQHHHCWCFKCFFYLFFNCEELVDVEIYRDIVDLVNWWDLSYLESNSPK